MNKKDDKDHCVIFFERFQTNSLSLVVQTPQLTEPLQFHLAVYSTVSFLDMLCFSGQSFEHLGSAYSPEAAKHVLLR